MGNAFSTTEEQLHYFSDDYLSTSSQNSSNPSIDRSFERLNDPNGKDFPPEGIAIKQEQMNSPGRGIAKLWKDGGEEIPREDRLTESFSSDGVYKYQDGTTYKG